MEDYNEILWKKMQLSLRKTMEVLGLNQINPFSTEVSTGQPLV